MGSNHTLVENKVYLREETLAITQFHVQPLETILRDEINDYGGMTGKTILMELEKVISQQG